MKFENKDTPFLFESTNIPDIFFTDYLSELPSDGVKLYLYIIFLSKNNKLIKINDLSKKLGLSIQTINENIELLEKSGLLIKKTNGFIVQNLQEVTLNKLYSPNLTLSEEKVEDIAKDKSKAKAIDHINKTYFSGLMSGVWINDINNWFDFYNFDPDVMITLFDYCYNKSKLNKSYITAVADNWKLNNIKTWSELDTYMQDRDKINIIKKKIAKKLNRYNGFTEYEESYIETWVTKYKYDMDIIEIALKRSTYKNNITFEYLNTLISSWHENNLKTAVEINNYIENSKVQNNKNKNLKQAVSTINYMQHNYGDLSGFYANV